MFKPEVLCLAPSEVFAFYQGGMTDVAFFQMLSATQRGGLANLQLTLRTAEPLDIPRIEQLVCSRYGEALAREISPFDSYRYIKFGQVLLVEDVAGGLAACVYQIGYEHPLRPSYLLRLVVRQDFENHGLATVLNRLAAALAYEQGSRSRHALLSHANPASLYVHLNKVGSYFRDLVDVPCDGIQNHFVSDRPLSAQGMVSNVINDNALLALCDGDSLPANWAVVNAMDLNTLRYLMRKQGLAVVAAIPRRPTGDAAGGQQLLLTPMEHYRP